MKEPCAVCPWWYWCISILHAFFTFCFFLPFQEWFLIFLRIDCSVKSGVISQSGGRWCLLGVLFSSYYYVLFCAEGILKWVKRVASHFKKNWVYFEYLSLAPFPKERRKLCWQPCQHMAWWSSWLAWQARSQNQPSPWFVGYMKLVCQWLANSLLIILDWWPLATLHVPILWPVRFVVCALSTVWTKEVTLSKNPR